MFPGTAACSPSRRLTPCSWAEPRDEEAVSTSLSLRHYPYHPRWGSIKSISQKGFPLRGLTDLGKQGRGLCRDPHATQWVQEPDKAGVTVVAKREVTWVKVCFQE